MKRCLDEIFVQKISVEIMEIYSHTTVWKVREFSLARIIVRGRSPRIDYSKNEWDLGSKRGISVVDAKGGINPCKFLFSVYCNCIVDAKP